MTTQDIKPGYKQSQLGLIPNNWIITNLGQICDIYQPKTISGSEINETGKYRVYGANGIIGYYNQYNHENSEVTMTCRGATCGTINFTKPQSWITGNAMVITPKSDDIIKPYLKYRLSLVKLNTIITGAAQPQITRNNLEYLSIPLPPLQEQEAIAKILGKVDETIEKTQNMIEKLELRNKGLEQKLLTGKIRLKGFNGEFKKLSADRIFKSVSIKNLPNEELLSATQEQGIIPRSMLEGRVTMPTSEAKSYKLVVPGNFVISLRSFQGGLEYSKYRGIVSPAYTVLDHILPICYDYYKYYFKSYDFIGHLSIAVVGIRDGKQISFDDFCTLNLPYPGIEEQKAIANILNKANKQLNKYEQKLEKLQELKKGLMQQLLTGKVRVKEFRN